MSKLLKLLAPLLTLGLTATALAAPGHRPTAAKAKAIARGKAYAQAHCASCHGITANSSSPNPESPPWDDIANREGVTERNFAEFLADAHNYPLAMDVTVQRAAIRDVAAYMLTLRRPGYQPTR